jgi:hypothetical protein
MSLGCGRRRVWSAKYSNLAQYLDKISSEMFYLFSFYAGCVSLTRTGTDVLDIIVAWELQYNKCIPTSFNNKGRITRGKKRGKASEQLSCSKLLAPGGINLPKFYYLLCLKNWAS